jgi:fumarylacetoacetase
MTSVNATHDPALRSWVTSANHPGADFPIQNLPFGVFRRTDVDGPPRCGVAIGEFVADISAISDMFEGVALQAARACESSNLNPLLQIGLQPVSELRAQLSRILAEDNIIGKARATDALIPRAELDMVLPISTAGYTDFFSSVHHATNAGRLFRPDQPLLPNYKYVPIAYNGRANSIQVSGDPITRPRGQIKIEGAEPSFGPTDRLDHEVELGMIIGRPSAKGRPVDVSNAWDHIFGFTLLNDWSARDVQSWEYQPLGPFLAKSFATSISPWIVTAEALAPFRKELEVRMAGDPTPMPYLLDAGDQKTGALNIQIDAYLSSQKMREQGHASVHLSRSNTDTLYWTFAQMIAHHTSNGSAIDSADVMGTGTISGPTDDALGSLLEITRGGRRQISLPSGEERLFLADGDEVCLKAFCEHPGFKRIGFGECRALILPAN